MRLLHSFVKIAFACCITSCVLAGDKIPEFSGDFIQGGLVVGNITPGSKVKINDHGVRVSVSGEFIIGFGRDYPAKAILTVTEQNGSKHQHALQIEQREYKIQRINGLPKA